MNQLLERGEIGRNVVIGLDPTLDFLSTARADDGNQIQAQDQLSDRLAGRLPGGVASRENKAGTNKVKLKSLLFFPRRIGLSVLEGLKSVGRNQVHMLSTTHVIHALARKRKASPRKWKVEIRVLVDEPESVALLCFGGVPVARQTVPTSGDAKVAALSSVIQRMAAAAQTELNLGEWQAVVLQFERQGRSERWSVESRLATEDELRKLPAAPSMFRSEQRDEQANQGRTRSSRSSRITPAGSRGR